MDNQTAGAHILQHYECNNNDRISAQQAAVESEKERFDNLIYCMQHFRKKVPCPDDICKKECEKKTIYDVDFFVQILLKKESTLSDKYVIYNGEIIEDPRFQTISSKYIATYACPTPNYDQSLFRFDHKKESLEYVWSIPDQETCLMFIENKDIIVPKDRAVLKNILDFYDGTLFQMAKRFNGETTKPGVLLEGF